MATRFARRGKSKVYWVTTLSSTTAPTVAQITGGLDLSSQVASIDGFTVVHETGEVQYLDSPFAETERRARRVGRPALTLYERGDGATTWRAPLAEGSAGWVVLCGRRAPQAGDRVEVWPVTSAGIEEQWDIGNTAAVWRCAFAVTAEPNTEAVAA